MNSTPSPRALWHRPHYTIDQAIALDDAPMGPLHEEFLQWVATCTTPGRHVLELGCSTGRLAIAICRKWPESRVMASEASTQLLDLARYALEVERLTHRIQLHHADEERPFPFPDAYFDTIVAHLVLHRIDRPQEWIAEAIRCLQPGGSLLLRDWLPGDLAGDGTQLPDSWQAMIPWRIDPLVQQSIWSFEEIAEWPLPAQASWQQMERSQGGLVWSGVIRKTDPQHVA